MKIHPRVFFGTSQGVLQGFFYILQGFLVHLGGWYISGVFFCTIMGSFLYNYGGFLVHFRGIKYTSGGLQDISSGFCRTFSGLLCVQIARRRWLFWE